MSFKDKTTGKYRKTEWKNSKSGMDFRPSVNIAPTDVTPVLVNAHHFDKERYDPILYPMLWGMIPPWHKVHVEDLSCWNAEWSETEGWKGPTLLKLAGLFNAWMSPEGKPIYSYTIITMESNSKFSWLHHRMPAILRSEEEVADWIDSGRVPPEKAMELLKPVEDLAWHPVSTAVNNARNKAEICNKPIDLKKPKPVNPLMMNWLKKANHKPESNENLVEDDESLPVMKKIKTE